MSLLLNLPQMSITARSGLLVWSTRSRFAKQLANSGHLTCITRTQRLHGLSGSNDPNTNRQFPAVRTQQLRNFVQQHGPQRQVPQQPFNKKDGDRKAELPPPVCEPSEPEQLGLFARFKKMAKEYWYVLIPVHCVTSVFWFGGFYYASKSGVDVIAILEYMGVSPKLIDPVRDSSLGHIAVAYLLYKIATPARYTVTLGGTTVSIKYLVALGYIKPMPSKARLVQMYKDKKEDLQEKIAEKKQTLNEKKQQLSERQKNLMDDIKKKARVPDEK